MYKLIFRITLGIATFITVVSSCQDSDKPVSQAEKIYISKCTRCHGVDGKKGAKGAKDLTVSKKTLEYRINQIREGKEEMPSFSNRLSDEHIKLVAQYTIDKFGGPDTGISEVSKK